MDIPAIVSSVWIAIQPLLPLLATKGAEKLGEEVGGALWEAVQKKFKNKPTAKESLEDLKRTPEDSDIQAAFRVQLKKVLQEDSAFVKELELLLESVESSHKAKLDGGGAIAQGEGATAVGKGGINIGGSVSGSTIITGNKNKVSK
jgi:hypothetical protein